MTLLLACASPEGLILAGDLQATNGSKLIPIRKGKWAKVGGWHVGWSGSAVFGQALEWHGASCGNQSQVRDLLSWMRATFMSSGLSPQKDEGVDWFDAHFILARNKQIFLTDRFMFAHEVPEGEWAALGCASDYADGCLDMIAETGSPWAPSDIARMVIQLAEKRYASVNGCKVDVIADGQVVSLPRPGRGPMEVPE